MSSFDSATFERWNRKLHYYAGLFLLFFLWLFLLTGLILNHPQWKLSQLAGDRQESRYEQAVQLATSGTELARARDLMNQLHLAGEIELPATQSPDRFDFNDARPKDFNQVSVNVGLRTASIRHFENGRLTIFRVFHTFSGTKFNRPDTARTWMVTSVWIVAMDALATGLVLMVLSSYYMWYQLKRTHALGWLALLIGAASTVLFLAPVFW